MFSIIIPVYNRGALLKRALDSVVAQTCRSFEAIIVDDGSTENIAEIIDAYQDDRLIYLKVPNMGAGIARNIGIALAHNEWIAFLDSDDWWPENKLEKFNQYIAERPSAGFIYSGFTFFDETRQVLSKTFIDRPPVDIRRAILKHNFVYSLPTVVVKRSLVMQINGFDVVFPARQDVDLYVRLADITSFDFIADSLCFVSFNATGRISSKKSNRLNGFLLFYKKYRVRMDSSTRAFIAKRIAIYAFKSRAWLTFIRFLPRAIPSLLSRKDQVKDL